MAPPEEDNTVIVDFPTGTCTPMPMKKLSLKEVARRFETGAGLEDYRTINLNETSEQLLQQTLRTMPKGKLLMKDLVRVVQDLQGRVAGRNSDDAAQIQQGLIDLQEQWRSLEKSTKQAAKELTESAAAKQTANIHHETQHEERYKARIAELEAEVACLRSQVLVRHLAMLLGIALSNNTNALHIHIQVIERDTTICQLQQFVRSRATSESAEQKENFSPMRDSSNLGSSDHMSVVSSLMSRRSPAKQWTPMSAVSEELSPAELRNLAIIGRPAVGQTLQVTSSGGVPVDDLPLQWFRGSGNAAAPSMISGAVRPQYSPEPADIGCVMLCRVGRPSNPDTSATLQLSSPIAGDPGLESEASRLAEAGEASFVVVPVQHNGVVQRSRTVATLLVNQQGMSVCADGAAFASSAYHHNMQVCGARGGGDGAAQGMFLALNADHVFMLALESPRSRNICILVIRKLAAKHSLTLEGPQDNI